MYWTQLLFVVVFLIDAAKGGKSRDRPHYTSNHVQISVLHSLCCSSTSTSLERRHGSTVQHRSFQHFCRSNYQCSTHGRQKVALVAGANLQLVTLFHCHSSFGVFLDRRRKSSSQNDDGPPIHGCYRSHGCW